MEVKEKKDIFTGESSLDDRMDAFHDKLRKHLSNEYIFLSDKKQALENEMLQMKIEMEQKDRSLFPSISHEDARKYFSPLNYSEIEDKQKSKKEKEMNEALSKISDELSLLEERMEEIKDFLRNMESIFSGSGEAEEEEIGEITSDEYEYSDQYREEFETDYVDPYDEKNEKTEKKEKTEKTEDPYADYFNINEYWYNHEVYPQFLRNLYEIVDYFKKKYKNVDILLEFNDNNIELDTDMSRNILNQIIFNIREAILNYQVNIVLLQGKVTDQEIIAEISYSDDHGIFDTMKTTYEIKR